MLTKWTKSRGAKKMLKKHGKWLKQEKKIPTSIEREREREIETETQLIKGYMSFE